MNINISDLTTDKCEQLSVDTKVEMESITRRGEILNFIEPVWVKGQLYKIEENIIFSGSLKTVIKTECSRCLNDVIRDISFDFNETIVGDDNNEADVMIDVENDCINLEVFLERLLILKLPMRFLCKDDCKGLCPQCGENLNDSECECEEGDIDIRLIKLKELLKQD